MFAAVQLTWGGLAIDEGDAIDPIAPMTSYAMGIALLLESATEQVVDAAVLDDDMGADRRGRFHREDGDCGDDEQGDSGEWHLNKAVVRVTLGKKIEFQNG